LIARVSVIFLLPVFEKSVIFNDFRAIAQSVSALEGGNTVCCNVMARNRTVDDNVTYWFPWKHPMARRQGIEFGVLDQTPRKWARRLGPSGLAIRLFRRLCTKTQPKCGLGHAALAFGASQMHQAAPIFSRSDVRLAVSDMLRSTPTTLSVLCVCACLGMITTTRRILDREKQSEHVLEVYQPLCSLAVYLLSFSLVHISLLRLHAKTGCVLSMFIFHWFDSERHTCRLHQNMLHISVPKTC